MIVHIYRQDVKILSIKVRKEGNRYCTCYYRKNEILKGDILEYEGKRSNIIRLYEREKELIMVANE